MTTLTNGEAEFVLKQIITQAQQDLQRRLAPVMHELTELAHHKPPQPHVLPDGRAMVYVGPAHAEIAGREYKAPTWLCKLASDDPVLAYALRRYREATAPQRPMCAHVDRREGGCIAPSAEGSMYCQDHAEGEGKEVAS